MIKQIRCSDYIKYVNESNQLHREDGPAIEFDSGHLKGAAHYYYNGLLHRCKGPASIYSINEFKKGAKEWWKNGKKHRLNAPAVTLSDSKKEYWEFGNFIK